MKQKKKCIMDDCNNLMHSKGYCQKHVKRIQKYGDPNYCHKNYRSAEERFEDYHIKHRSGCWLWTGKLSFGFGRIIVHGYQMRAHRYAYEKFKKKSADGKKVLHTCENNHCVNPDHLYTAPWRKDR